MKFTTVPGFSKYEVTRSGILRNRESKKILKGHIDDVGYRRTSIADDSGQTKNKRIHTLVGATYKPNPHNKPHLNHENGQKLDNRTKNISWCTQAENVRHAYKTGLSDNKGEKNGRAKFTVDQVIEIKKLFSEGMWVAAISRKVGITPMTVSDITRGNSWSHIPFPKEKENVVKFRRPSVKLTAEDVLEIRRLLDKGWTQIAIGEKFGKPSSAISNIKLGKFYKHVQPSEKQTTIS